jgi:hypothetical protein
VRRERGPTEPVMMRVFVRQSSSRLAVHHRAMFRRSMWLLAALLPSTALVLWVNSRALSEEYRDTGPAIFWFAVVFTLVLIGGLTAVYMRWNRRRRLALVGNPIWVSRFGMLMGPTDEGGLPDIADWMGRHTRRTARPLVLLALTPSTFEIVPWEGKREKLVVPFNEVQSVEIVFGGRKQRGFSIYTTTGAHVDLSFKPDARLVEHLRTLGAEIVEASPSSSRVASREANHPVDR